MRYYACRFVSENAVDWEKAVPNLEGRFFTFGNAGLIEKIKPYNFWDEAKSAKADIPSSPLLWHYNPVTFMEQLLYASARSRVKGEHFDKDRSFPLSSISGRVNGCAEFIRGKANPSLLAFGYTNQEDTTGDKKALSENRAKAVVMLLNNDVDAWAQNFKSGVWGNWEKQRILAGISKSGGTTYYQIQIDGANGPKQKAAVEDFQRDNGLSVDGDAGPNTLKKMYEKYYSLKEGDVKLSKTEILGCEDEYKDITEDALCDLLVFSGGILPKLSKYKAKPKEVFEIWQQFVEYEISKAEAAKPPEEESVAELITMEMLKCAVPSGKDSYFNTILPHLNKYAEVYSVNTPSRIAHFLSQVGHESAFKVREESLNYSIKRMQQIFGCKSGGWDGETCAVSKRKRMKLWNNPDDYVGSNENQQRLANYVYADRLGNGDEESGDGYKYRGRGIIQLTGKSNYTSYKRIHNNKNPDDIQDFVSNPDLIVDNIEYGVESAFVWWDMNGMNPRCEGVADDDVKTVTKKVNGGYNGLEDRKEKFKKLLELIEENQT